MEKKPLKDYFAAFTTDDADGTDTRGQVYMIDMYTQSLIGKNIYRHLLRCMREIDKATAWIKKQQTEEETDCSVMYLDFDLDHKHPACERLRKRMMLDRRFPLDDLLDMRVYTEKLVDYTLAVFGPKSNEKTE